ncbi:MAG TPA: 3-isopropylmalate dehydrogenase [Clostridiales bacterium]|nr:3-isopropylmalate dehydrogenase [Clostridiales bacterium]
MKFNIVTVPGDGIGPDIIREAIVSLNRVGEIYGHEFAFTEKPAGGIAIDTCGCPLPEDTVEACKKSDSVLLGAVGGPKWDHLGGNDRPEKALLGLRGELKLFANLRPALLHRQLKDACPLKPEIIGDSLDILIVRELTSGIYFGKRGRVAEDNSAYDTMYYSVPEIERVLRVGFDAAMKRSKKVCVVDKANILETSRLWREVTARVAKDYPEVEYSHLYVDNCSMQLVRNPKQFDVIITTNMFGDILSDEASMLTGSIGMLASASLGETSLGMYEPIHGSAPDIAGKDIANPIATVLSAAMMLRYSFGLEKEAQAIEKAVDKVLDEGYRTADIYEDGMKKVGTRKMGELIAAAIE